MKFSFSRKKIFDSCVTEIVCRERHKHNIKVIRSDDSGVSEEEELNSRE